MLTRITGPDRTRGRRLRAAVVGALLALAAVLTTPAAPALAHDRLVSSGPEDEERLTTGPEEVTLVFSGEVMDVGAAVTVLDAEGAQVSRGGPAIDGDEVSQRLSGALPDGGYVVRWRVVSGDGHPISGAFPFAVGEDTDLPDLTAPPSSTWSSRPSSGDGAAPTDRLPRAADNQSPPQSVMWERGARQSRSFPGQTL
ncbi:copper resistance CopC family protein [Nocardiopsis suaedae]|uniref:Copper resistance protein CopC n=1 Tax=Nocardiopsis suaedae TaxID=3018444 RepID=A0ABT4TF85_9ACTN|nr:copper resistance CopC family protein [Nocardiopsis suaedae]MDA2802954.1 copper resistance protein CopC [Nocardiopsis suaedae]